LARLISPSVQGRRGIFRTFRKEAAELGGLVCNKVPRYWKHGKQTQSKQLNSMP
jgi:hypothetical protein